MIATEKDLHSTLIRERGGNKEIETSDILRIFSGRTYSCQEWYVLIPQEQEQLSPSEMEYREQKKAFEAIPPLFLSPYRGRFVAVRNGEIMDSDTELAALTNRFFGQHGDVPVYIGKVDEKLKVSIDTPFLS